MGLLGSLFNRTPTSHEFAKLIIEKFAERGIVNMEYVAENFSLKRMGTTNVIYLHNFYRNYCAVGRSGRQEVLARLLGSLADENALPADFDSARKNILPVVRDRRRMHLTSLALSQDGRDKARFSAIPFAPELVISIAYDTEQTIQYPNDERIAEWQTPLEEIARIAKDNLRERTDPNLVREISNGVYVGEWNDSYEAARMVLPDFFYRLGLSGDPVVMAPNRHLLLITGSYDTAGQQSVLTVGGQAHFQQGYSLSPNLYVLRDSKWELFTPPDNVVRLELLSIQKRREASDYNEQKAVLDKIHQRDKLDVFVAGSKVYKRTTDGVHFTRAIWSNGIPTLLPKSDEIAMYVNPTAPKEQNDVFLVAWEVLVAALGTALVAEPDLVPERYRVQHFPTGEQFRQLRLSGKAPTQQT